MNTHQAKRVYIYKSIQNANTTATTTYIHKSKPTHMHKTNLIYLLNKVKTNHCTSLYVNQLLAVFTKEKNKKKTKEKSKKIPN